MTKREHDPRKWKTAGDVTDTARVRGANVKPSGGWNKISTPNGVMKITANDNQELDTQTLANARRWFKLLGLMVLIAVLVYLFL